MTQGSAPPAVLKWGRWRDRDIHARFELEAEVLKALGPPSTPALIGSGSSEGWPYLIMEHVAGETLAAWMSRNADRGGLGEILAILDRIAATLEVVHAGGYVHRDLKPENVCISSRGVRLLDFGLAKSLRDRRGVTEIGAVVGTPHYIAPEQIRTGGTVDPQADLYSLGVIAFEMLAGRPPFVGERRAIEYQHQVGRPPRVRETREIPEELEAVIAGCLAKDVARRPASAAELRKLLASALASLATLRGFGVAASPEPKPLGDHGEVALAWIVGGDPVQVCRVMSAMHGIVVRQRGESILVAFSAQHHDAPVAAALAACRELIDGERAHDTAVRTRALRARCRIAIHVANALVRRSALGKPMVYGPAVEDVAAWAPSAPFPDIVLTAAAAAKHGERLVPADVDGFFRERHAHSDVTDAAQLGTKLVGRTAIVEQACELLARGHALVGISGEPGLGKSRVFDAIVDRLGREVIAIRARRRFDGERADDQRLATALGARDGSFAAALATAGRRGAIVAIDDADRLSPALQALLAGNAAVPCLLTSARPLFEVPAGATDRLAIALPRLEFADASRLVRELLLPARLVPEVLVERIVLRGSGLPRMLIALAQDAKRNGLRHHPGSEEWYLAVDELDTLLVPPDAGWLATHALENLPPELAPVARACSGLGPRFCADEVGAAVGIADAEQRLRWLVREHVLDEHAGWFEFVDPALQEAIYDFVLDDRERVHARALALWLASSTPSHAGWLARVAFHAVGAHQAGTAVACFAALARQALRRGEHAHAEHLLSRAIGTTVDVPPRVREAILALE